MKKHIIRNGALAIFLTLALLSLATCDQWINDEIMVVNETGNTIRAHIEFEDGGRTDYQIIGPFGDATFYTAYWDDDKYTPIMVFVDDLDTGFLYESDGNLAANDWLTVVYFNGDTVPFRRVF